MTGPTPVLGESAGPDRYFGAVDSAPFISYAQNREDVVVHRALRSVDRGRYVEVGANHPVDDSVTYALYERGWSGIAVEPVPAFAERLRATRPRDVVIEAAITAEPVDTITLHQIDETGLSTVVDDIGSQHAAAGFAVRDVEVPARTLDAVLDEAGWDGQDIHLMLIDTEGSEQSVLESVDLRRWRPWVLVIESTRPNSTEPTHEAWEPLVLAADYRFCQFDGLSRFYVPAERWDQLHADLTVPANILDHYKPWAQARLEVEIDRLNGDLTDRSADIDRLRQELSDQEAEYTEAILEWRAAAVRALSRGAGSARQQQVDDLLSQIHLHVNHITMVDAELARARKVIGQLESEIEALHRTVSWRVTVPLRSVRSVTRGRR